jgi:nucleoside-diphosphate-sugar epimerase
LPRPKPSQDLSLVFVKDLADAVLRCLLAPVLAGTTYFVASRQVVTAEQMGQEIARQMGRWTFPCPLPAWLQRVLCAGGDLWGRLTGRAQLLSRQKLPELQASGWVCDPARLEHDLGHRCATELSEGIGQTLDWYRLEGWL